MLKSTTYLEENTPHLNTPVIFERIRDIDKFAMVHTRYTNENHSYTKELNEHYCIRPIRRLGENEDWMETGEECYDNQDKWGKVIMNRDEMLINFTLNFGKTVEYEMEFESDGFHSNDRISYIGKIRR